jgi:hypothetical protein
MSLSTQTNKQSYSDPAGTTSFEFGISYFDNSDIQLTIESALGVIVEYDQDTPDYAVVATNGDTNNGCTVTLDGTTFPSGTTAGDTVVISRQVPYTQEYDLQNGSSIDPTALNRGLDRTVAQSQQLLDDGSRHLTHPITDPANLTYNAPSVLDRASKAVGWDVDGNVVALSLSDSGTVTGNENAGITVANNIISAKVDGTSAGFDGTGAIEVKDGGIIEAKLATDAVTPDKIQALAVTNAKIANGAVDTEELAAGAVTLAKIDADASTGARGVIRQATDGQVITGTDEDTAVSPANITALFNDSGQQDVTGSANFQLLPGGLVLQWGLHATTTTGNKSVTFDHTGWSNVLSVTLTPQVSPGDNAMDAFQVIGTPTTSGFTAYVPTNVNSLLGFYWFAIGL